MKKFGSAKGLTRRQLLKNKAGAVSPAALLSAARAAVPAGAFAQASGPEIKKATFGYIYLTLPSFNVSLDMLRS